MKTLLNIALRNLFQAKRRTLLLGLAVSIVSCLFLILQAVSSSVGERMIESATTLSAGHVNIGGFYKVRKKSAAPIIDERDMIKKAVAEIIPEHESIIDRHRGWGRIISPASSINVGMSGLTHADEGRFFNTLRLAKESEYKTGGSDKVFGNFEDLKRDDTILIFAAQAKKLEVGVGDSLTIVTEASGGQDNTVDLKVAAIVSDLGFMSNWNVFVTRKTILDLYRMNDKSTGVVMLYLKDPDEALGAMERLRSGLKAKGLDLMDHDPNPFFFKFEKVMGEDWLGQKIDLTLWKDEISMVAWVTDALGGLSFFVTFVLAIIIIGGIMNSQWMSVRERIKEIGTMRAIGTQKSFIAGLFVVESIFLGLIAAGIGVIIASVLLSVLNAMHIPITNDGVRLFLMSNEFSIKLHPGSILTTFILFSIITGLAALYPAISAARLKPVEALMHSK